MHGPRVGLNKFEVRSEVFVAPFLQFIWECISKIIISKIATYLQKLSQKVAYMVVRPGPGVAYDKRANYHCIIIILLPIEHVTKNVRKKQLTKS